MNNLTRNFLVSSTRKLFVSSAYSAVAVALFAAEIAHAKPIKNKYSRVENGKMPTQMRTELTQEVIWAKQNMSQEQYERVVADPQKALNDQERLAGLSAREIFILVDRSGSMGTGDRNPTSGNSRGWTRWDSARVAVESISEVALSLDTDGKVDVMLWDGGFTGVRVVEKVMTRVSDVEDFFRKNRPSGGTPLAGALKHVYKKRLKSLLRAGEPFTVVILTDGSPNDEGAVKHFFKKIVKKNNLESSGRETLAAFSFVRMGDDPGAIHFLEDLDDNLIRQTGIQVDIVDTKEDNFLFGTGRYYGQNTVGPFALFWDALYD